MIMKRKSDTRFGHKLDKFFWFFISFWPVFGWLFSMLGGQAPVSFTDYMATIFGSGLYSSNLFYSVLDRLFGAGGFFPLFLASSDGILRFFTYLCTVEIIHVYFDVIVFIPRLAHKWISKAVQDD